MTDIDYSSNYDFSLDPFVENTNVYTPPGNNMNTENNQSNENIVKQENKDKKMYRDTYKGGNGCKLLLVVILYLIIIETKLNFLLDTGLKKVIFVIFFWTVGYNIVNNLLGFDKYVCSHLF